MPTLGDSLYYAEKKAQEYQDEYRNLIVKFSLDNNFSFDDGEKYILDKNLTIEQLRELVKGESK